MPNGDAMFKWYVGAQAGLGWLQGAYSNYTDYCTVNTNWTPDHVMRLPDGEWRRSWPRNYKLKPSMAVEYDEYYAKRIKEKFGVTIEFPVIADLDRKVASAYGMVMPGESGTEAARSVFVIDDKHTLRAMIHYPVTTGRNVDEIVRLVKALQTADEYAVATPANWKPGDKVIVPPPKTQERAEALGEGAVVSARFLKWRKR